MSEIPFEAPPEDVADQLVEIDNESDADPLEQVEHNDRVGWDVDPADALEQAIDVPPDDEGP